MPFHNHRGITIQLSFTSEWQDSHATRHCCSPVWSAMGRVGRNALTGYFNARTTVLLGLGPIILCRDDLPVPVSFQPGVGPDENLNALASIGISADAAFATVKNSKIIPKKMNLYFTETALAIRVLSVFCILNFLLLCVSGSVWSRPLEIVCKRCLDG